MSINVTESICGMCHRSRYCPYCSGSLGGKKNGYSGTCHVTVNEHRANHMCGGESMHLINTQGSIAGDVHTKQLTEDITTLALGGRLPVRNEAESISVNGRTKERWYRRWTGGNYHAINRGTEFTGDIDIRSLKDRIEQWAHRHHYQPTVTVLNSDSLMVKMVDKQDQEDIREDEEL